MRLASYWSHTFLPEMIRPDGVVFDFGVNYGGFSNLVAPLCHRVIGFEPDPTWKDRLSVPGNVTVVPAALAARSGRLQLSLNRASYTSLNHSDPGAQSVEVNAITIEDALNLAPGARIDLVKLDIEGDEVPVLLGASSQGLERIVQMTVEFHDFLDPQSLPAVRSFIARLERLGFTAIRFSWHSYGDVLFVNQRLLSLWQRVSLKIFHKYGRGIGRIMARIIGRAFAR